MNGSQAFAIIESTLSDTCHAIRNSDGSQAFAAIVFVFNYYTVSYTLNDRKVIRRILWSVKKCEI